MSALFLLKLTGIGLLIIVLIFIFSLVELYTQIGRYKNYWEKNNHKTGAPNEILYVALGDSTAQGIGATSPARGYVGLIAEGLGKNKNQPVRVVNFSKSGAKIKDVLDTQLPEAKKAGIDKKTVVTIEIGANDMVSFNATEFEKQMDEVMKQLPGQALISDIPYFGGTRFKGKEKNVAEANKIMYKLASKHGYELVPIHDQIKKNGGFRTLAADFFHPSNVSYRENWAPLFLERL